MAGLGRKVFNAGEVLSAANVQGYLQDQVVQVYSGTAARSSALGTAVSEGMTSYLTDSNELSVYTSNGTAAWSPVSLVQSPNVIINGGFDFWQRSTSFTMPNTDTQYGAADRWLYWHNGSTAGTNLISRQTHTRGQTLVPGNPTYFQRWTSTSLGSGQTISDFQTKIEDVGTLAGQTVTLSFYSASSTAGKTIDVYFTQIFGSGGSTAVDTTVTTAATLTTGFARYTVTVTLPSISGKTVGAGDNLRIIMRLNGPTAGMTWDLSNVQLEAGSVATPFRRNAPSLQGELAACQRYYFLADGTTMYFLAQGQATSSTAAQVVCQFPVTMRTAPSLTVIGTLSTQFILINSSGGSAGAPTALTLGASATNKARIDATIASGLSAGNATTLQNGNTGTGLSFSAEL